MNHVPARAEWKSSVRSNGKSIESQTFKVFGWSVTQYVLPVGASLVSQAKEDVPAKRAPNRTMYVRGRAECSTDGVRHDDRVPGLYTMDRPTQPAGMSTSTAVEETELWCFNWTANRRSLPDLTPIRLQAGESYEVPGKARVFVMHGSAGEIVGPACFETKQRKKLTAETPLYAFLIAEERP
jgi:hypothetical protein